MSELKINSEVIPSATDETIGGIKTGYTENGQNYKVQTDTDGNAYVNVPWTDSDTQYSGGVGIQLVNVSDNVLVNLNQASDNEIGGIKVQNISEVSLNDPSDTENRSYGVQRNSAGIGFVNVPWTDTNTKNTAGASSSTSKLYLIGATEQTENPQTYTRNNVYIDSNGYLCQGGYSSSSNENQMYRLLSFNLTNPDIFTPAGAANRNIYKPLQWDINEGFTHHSIKYTSVFSRSNQNPEVIPISGPITIIELREHRPTTLILRLLGEPVGAINNGNPSGTNILTTTSSSSIFAPRKVIIFVDSYSSSYLETINYQCLNNLTVNTIRYTAYDYSHGRPDEGNVINGTPMLNCTLGSYVLELDLFLDTSTTPYKWNIFGTQKYTNL